MADAEPAVLRLGTNKSSCSSPWNSASHSRSIPSCQRVWSPAWTLAILRGESTYCEAIERAQSAWGSEIWNSPQGRLLPINTVTMRGLQAEGLLPQLLQDFALF